MKKMLPNILTLSRIAMIPLLWWLFLEKPFSWNHYVFHMPVPFWGILFVILAGTSDLIDGILARAFRSQSVLGRLLDPIADKIFITTCFIFLLYLGRLHPVGVILVVSRDALISIVRTYAATCGVVISASNEAKVKTTLQFIAVGFLIHYDTIGILPWVPVKTIGLVLFWLSIVLSYFTLGRYIFDFFTGTKTRPALNKEKTDRFF